MMTHAFALALLVAVPVRSGEHDIFDRDVPVLSARPTVVLFANRATGDAIQDPLSDFSVRTDDLHPLIIVRLDLRDLPGLFRGFAYGNMRSRFSRALKCYKDESARLGHEPIQHAEDSLFFVVEDDGKAHRAQGLPPGFRTALAIAYDATGREIARGPFPASAPLLEQALRSAER